jgi:hypothetical protein
MNRLCDGEHIYARFDTKSSIFRTELVITLERFFKFIGLQIERAIKIDLW